MHVDIFRPVVFCPVVLLSYFMLWCNVVAQMHCSGLAWHPDVATQMVLASEDDRLPVIQMWDLRFASSPLRVLESHTRYESYVACCSMVFELLVTAYQFLHVTVSQKVFHRNTEVGSLFLCFLRRGMRCKESTVVDFA